MTKKITEKQYLEAVKLYASHLVKQTALQAKWDADKQKLTDKYSKDILMLETNLEEQYAIVKEYCKQNRHALFGEAQTIQQNGLSIGFRKGKGKLELLATYTWDKVVGLLKKKKLTEYIRTKEEVDKTKLLADGDKLSKKLAGLGVTIDKSETFFIDKK